MVLMFCVCFNKGTLFQILNWQSHFPI
jgi:hypothetical protein